MTTPTTAEPQYTVSQGAEVAKEFTGTSNGPTIRMGWEILRLRATIARLKGRPEMLVVPAQHGLDPVRVFFVDHEPGKGTLVISCYGEAWSCYFGAMGKRTLRQFVASVSRDYLGNAMRVGNAHYRERIANAVILACRDAVAAVSPDTATTEG